MNLRFKLLVPLAVLFGLVAIFLHYAALPLALKDAEDAFEKELQQEVSRMGAVIGPAIAAGDDAELAAKMSIIVATHPNWKRVRVDNRDGRVLWSSDGLVGHGVVRDESGATTESRPRAFDVVYEQGQVVGEIVYLGIENPTRKPIQNTFKNFFWVLVSSLLLSLALIAFLLGPVVISPIRALVRGAERLANRDFRAPVTHASEDEVGRLAKSVNTLRSAMRAHELDQRKSAMAIQELAHYDEVTGLPNKAYLYNRLATALDHAADTGTGVALMFVDIQDFTSINDLVGYEAGDRCLREAAHRLVLATCGREGLKCDVATMRDGTTDGPRFVARYSADAFLVLFTDLPRDITGEHLDASVDLDLTARQLQGTLLRSFETANRTFSLATNIGISRYPDNGVTPTQLIQHAGTALNAAKVDDDAAIRYFTDTLNATTFRRLSLRNSVGDAPAKGEMSLRYQTKVDLRSGVITGVEALARWHHPVHGEISPAEFIPLSEQTGKIVDLGQWVIATACAQSRAWEQAGLPPIRVAVNVSSRQMLNGRLIEDVKSALEETQLNPSYLEIELTEGTLMSRPEQTAEILDELKALGVSISVDDFGTGYSSLNYLHRFPLDALKIDRSFVATVGTDENSRAIIRAIVSMARGLDLAVIAEGVENEKQLEFLLRTGCDDVQGFLLGKPDTPDSFEQTYDLTKVKVMETVQEKRRQIGVAEIVA